MLFALSLARRGFMAFSLHPGLVPTNLAKYMTEQDMAEKGECLLFFVLFTSVDFLFGDVDKLCWWCVGNVPDEIKGQRSALKTLEQGGSTHVIAAFDTSIAGMFSSSSTWEEG